MESPALVDPERWGLSLDAVHGLGDRLQAHWERYRPCFKT